MKKLGIFLIVGLVGQLQAAPEKKGKHVSIAEKSVRKITLSSLIKQDDYSWYEQFVESIEDGDDSVAKYVAMKPELLTKIDKVSGMTPLEIAVVSDNEQAVATILSIASRKNIPLAMEMAINKADKTKNEMIQNMLIFSFVEGDKK